MAGTVVETRTYLDHGKKIQVELYCVGDASNGSIPNTAITGLEGFYIYSAEAWPKAGGTAPDAADVTLTDVELEDVLGGNGVGLIHATAKQSTLPEIAFMTLNFYQLIKGTLTFAVANQTTNSATYYVRFTFTK